MNVTDIDDKIIRGAAAARGHDPRARRPLDGAVSGDASALRMTLPTNCRARPITSRTWWS
jgi:cysteinyl-tRNA synthetase